MKVTEQINYDKNIRFTVEKPPVRHRFAQATKCVGNAKTYKRQNNWRNNED